MLETVVLTFIILAVLTALVFWVLKFDNDLVQTIALIVYGLCFVATIVNFFIEVLKVAL